MSKDIYSISLRDIIPPSIINDPQVQAIIDALDPELQSVSQDTREALIISRIDELSEEILDLLAWQWHVDFYEPTTLTLASKRRIVKSAIKLHRLKGTRQAIEEGLRTIGVESKVIPWFEMEPKGKPYTFALDGWLMEDFRTDGSGFLDKDTMSLIRRMIDETKSVRDGLLDITLGIGFDDHVEVTDDSDFNIWRVIPLAEFYPWAVQLHDASALRSGRIHHNASISRDGTEKYASRRSGGVLRDARIDELGALDISLAGLEERITTTVYRNRIGVKRDGVARHGISGSPIDGGGAISVRTGAFRNGVINRDGGQRLVRDASIHRNGNHEYYSGGNRHGWRTRDFAF